jgi:glycosyltransferase involved in cell wall biosynthesis
MQVGMTSSKRILHCIPTMEGGGAERQLVYLCRGLVERGWEAHVALLREGPNSRMLRESGAVVHPIRLWSQYDPVNILRLRRLIRNVKPGLVHTWFAMMDIIGGAACRITGTPQIISERCSSEAHPGNIKDLLQIIAASGARAVISNSSGGDEYWRGKNNGRFRRFIIHNALPLQEIEWVPPVPNAVIGGHPGQKIVLYVGRFDKQKNLKNLVRALGRVVQNPTLVAFLCGDGPMRPAVERMIHDEGLSGRIFLPGYVMNIWAWMKRADVFVSVSLFEGMPNTVMEAMACGCPAVVSDIPQHREILDDDSAVFVSPSDPMSIAAGIDRLLGDTEDAGRKALRAKKTAIKWSIPAMAERYERAYLEILGAVK